MVLVHQKYSIYSLRVPLRDPLHTMAGQIVPQPASVTGALHPGLRGQGRSRPAGFRPFRGPNSARLFRPLPLGGQPPSALPLGVAALASGKPDRRCRCRPLCHWPLTVVLTCVRTQVVLIGPGWGAVPLAGPRRSVSGRRQARATAWPDTRAASLLARPRRSALRRDGGFRLRRESGRPPAAAAFLRRVLRQSVHSVSTFPSTVWAGSRTFASE